MTEYPLPTGNAFPLRLVSGPDKAVWFVEFGAAALARITLDGEITEMPIADMDVGPGVTVGPDGAIWFTGYNSNRVGRMSLGGELTTVAVPTDKSVP